MLLTRLRRSLPSALLFAAACSFPAHAATVRTAHVAAELVADESALVPGTTATLALRLAIDPGWHTYWRNPGESGLPTTLAWRLPPGFAAGDIVWPAPHALPAGPLVNYGYEGEVLHLVPLTVSPNAQPGATASLTARAEWLVCKETCIPEGADVALDLPVARDGGPASRWHDAIAATRAALPKPLPAGWTASATASGSVIALQLQPPSNAGDPGRLRFFADAENRIEASAPQTQASEPDGRYRLDLPVAQRVRSDFVRLQGVLTASRGLAAERGTATAIALDIPLTGTPVAGPGPARPATIGGAPRTAVDRWGITLALAFALLGGLLLNLMPCVFPVLSLKALQLATSQEGGPRESRREGVAFAVGVVGAFVALGGAIAALRAAGTELGWGFQLQSPAVVTGLAMLFFVMALNLSGVFQFRLFVPSRLATWSHANRHVNAFASGVLAVAIASPCTAPFMGAALGYALAQGAHVVLGVFAALGVGMALPYLLLAWFPQWRRALPRPGAWMERLRQILAVPLYATVAWLVWVLAAQIGADAVIRIGVALVLVAFALWARRAWRVAARRVWSGLAAAGAIAALLVAWPLLAGEQSSGAAGARASLERITDGWEPYSATRVAELVDQGRPVFVDFTAAWCITCQVNERLVLADAKVRDALAHDGVALLRADWTRRDPEITRALAEIGRSGVPAYVLYRKGRAPQVLPEVLQRQTILGALAS